MKAKFESRADEKQEMAQRKESKRLDMLDTLKSFDGPFTIVGKLKSSLWMKVCTRMQSCRE